MNNIKNMENLIKSDIKNIIEKIIENLNYTLKISSNSRSGAEISDYIEDEIVKYFKSNQHPRIIDVEGAPKGKTKNPYDFKFNYNTDNFNDLIWADIKATNTKYKDSNPDLGTPKKLIKFILDGHFYILYVFLRYSPTNNDIMIFEPHDNGDYVKCIFLKDINKSVRINPKPQFQVNINEEEEYRTISNFIELFELKYSESLQRNKRKICKEINELDDTFEKVRKCIEEYQKYKFKK